MTWGKEGDHLRNYVRYATELFHPGWGSWAVDSSAPSLHWLRVTPESALTLTLAGSPARRRANFDDLGESLKQRS